MLGDKYEDTYDISIHALREEGDASAGAAVSCSANFYPRPPRGGRHCRRWTSKRLR